MKTALTFLIALATTGCNKEIQSRPTTPVANPVATVVLAAEAKWDKLNPARGERSPKAATLWGDRKGRGPTGFLFHAEDGFTSPPHLHNVSYRGIVIRGLIHNDDPKAAAMWMPAGSFWTQPKGEVHITSARGSDILAYIEIDDGPYLVRPVEQAFSSDEKPVNIDTSNIVWVGLANSTPAIRIAHVWGAPDNGKLSGSLLKLPQGFEGSLHIRSAFRAIIIQGAPTLQTTRIAALARLEPGSYFAGTEPGTHKIACSDGAECVIYLRAKHRFHVTKHESRATRPTTDTMPARVP